ncbi:MAG: hypothetical protein O3A25_00780 [Acidobacteria bacterium]|nr:hypothetical protein [Acidobacteriota bacterium]
MVGRYTVGVLDVLLVAWLGTAPTFAQPPAAPAQPPARTPWGDPDLQGIWNNFTITPLERPASLGAQAFLTAEEAADLERRAVAGVARQNAPSEVRAEPLPAGGDVGAYNSFWTDQGTRVVPTMRTSLIVDPPNGRLPELTDEALTRITSTEYRRLADAKEGRSPAYGPEDMGLSERCLWYRGIPSFPTEYNNNYQVFQNQDFIIILQEHIHDLRVIPLDGRAHLAPHVRQWAGSSRGHWDGDTLVVETTNLRSPFIRRWIRPEHSLSRGDLSDAVTVVERFTRVDSETMDYEFTVTDLKTWTQPWSGSLPMARTDGPMYEFACHEGNYGMANMLAGSRADERTPR